MKKKNVVTMFCKAMVLVSTTVMLGMKARAAGFNRDAMVRYASEHYDDGKGLCAEFASDCCEAAGLDVWSRGATTLHAQLAASGLGEEYVLPFDGRTTIEGYPVEPGDLVFYVCSDACDNCPYIHVVVAANSSSDETYLRAYSHNRANSGESTYWFNSYCYDCGAPVEQAVLYHFTDDKDGGNHRPQGEIDSVEYRDGKVYMEGWGFDRDRNGKVRLRASIGMPMESGGYTEDFYTGEDRDDVAAAYGCSRYCGFSHEFHVPNYLEAGRHTVYLYMLDEETGEWIQLGTEDVEVNQKARVELEEHSVTVEAGKTVQVGFCFSGAGIEAFGCDDAGGTIAGSTVNVVDWQAGRGVCSITGRWGGTTTVTVRLYDKEGGIIGSDTVAVSVKGTQGSASLSRQSVELDLTEHTQEDLVLEFDAPGGTQIFPEVSEEGIVEVDYGECGQNRLPMTVRAKKPGTAAISYTVKDAFGTSLAAATVTVTVKGDAQTAAETGCGTGESAATVTGAADAPSGSGQMTGQREPEGGAPGAVRPQEQESRSFVQKCYQYYKKFQSLWSRMPFAEWYEKYVMSGAISRDRILSYFR